jgi:hypothetical protein
MSIPIKENVTARAIAMAKTIKEAGCAARGAGGRRGGVDGERLRARVVEWVETITMIVTW